MSIDDSSSVSEDIEYDEEYADEFDQGNLSYSFIAPVTTTLRNKKNNNPLINKVLEKNNNSNSFIEESQYSEDFETSFQIATHKSHDSGQVDSSENLYSEDEFDVSHTASSVDNKQAANLPTSTSSVPMSSSIRHHQHGLLPPTHTQALQAEVALDELSKEVVRLRNEQKAVLKQRRDQAKIKKDRANKRRLEYQTELSKYKDEILSANKEKEVLRLQLREAQLKVTYLEEENRTLIQERQQNEDRLSIKHAQLIDVQTKFDAFNKKYEEDVSQWRAEKDKLVEASTRSELYIQVLQKNTELAQEKLAKDRDNLPEYHQTRLNDEINRLRDKESLLDERLSILKMEDEKRAATLEGLRREVMRELDQGRGRLEVEGSEMRVSLQKRQDIFERDREHFAWAKEKELKEYDILKASLANKENDLSLREAEVKRREMELEMHLHTLEPSLKSAERERQIALATIGESERKLNLVLERENRVLEAERGLRLREMAAEEEMCAALEYKTSVTQASMLSRREKERQEAQRNGLNAERFRLHTCAMEMSKQMLVIKQSLGYLLRQQRHVSVATAGGSQPLRSTAGGIYNLSGGDEEVNVDPAFANIMYALSAASGSLVSLAHNLLDPKDLQLHSPTPAPSSAGSRHAPEKQVAEEGSETSGSIIYDSALHTTPVFSNMSSMNTPLPRTESLQTLKTSGYKSLSQSPLDDIRVCSSSTIDLENVQVDNYLFDATESAKAVKTMAMKYGILL